jgi:hypothetical protein
VTISLLLFIQTKLNLKLVICRFSSAGPCKKNA